MKQVCIPKIGGPDVLEYTTQPDPSPGPGEVLVRVKACALNHLDLWIGRGVPGRDLDYPHVSGSDGCGRVEAVGDGVDEAWIGRRVVLNAALPRPEAALPGAWPAPTRHVIGEATAGTTSKILCCRVSSDKQ